jgi:tetratricopeptide (TPR) repeat protein
MNEKPSHSLFDELRRRGVVGPSAVYLAGAWAAIEVADTIFPRLGIPDWAVTLVVWIAVIAFPVVAAVAWFYEVGRGGIRRDRLRARTPRKLAVGLAALTGVVALVAWTAFLRPEPLARALDEQLVAVLPFRTAGADAELVYLGEGIVDLLAAKLTGEVGPRAVDPRTMMATWRRAIGSSGDDIPEDSALTVARSTGAGAAIIGSVVGSNSRMTITASLARSDGSGQRPIASVHGPADSLGAMIDGLAAQLLSLQSGQDVLDMVALSGRPLAAVRHFLAGEAAYRRGEYDLAVGEFRRALEFDSTFAMAAFGIERAAPWVPGRLDAREAAAAVAWRYRDELSRLDRAHLVGRVGPSYPAHPSARELLRARTEAVELLPDRAEVWYELGDLHFHWGRLIGEADHLERSIEGFRRALELDPDFAAPLHHLVLALAALGDTAALRELWAPFRHDSTGTVALYVRWRSALAVGDSAELARVQQALPGANDQLLREIAVDVLSNGLPIAHSLHAQQIRFARSGTPAERRERTVAAYSTALSAGRPAEAVRAIEALAMSTADADLVNRYLVLGALYAGGDSARAARAARALARGASDPTLDIENRCIAAQWDSRRGYPPDPSLSGRARAAAGDGRGLPGSVLAVCAELLDALRAVPGPFRKAALDRLDALLVEGPFTGFVDFGQPYWANLALAQLYDESGDLEAALAAARRRMYFLGHQPYMPAFFLAEARLNARLGQDDDAITAYRRYLNLRSDPEPSRRVETEAVQTELEALAGG